MMGERSPLLESASITEDANPASNIREPTHAESTSNPATRAAPMTSRRFDCFQFLEAQTPHGLVYEQFLILLIGGNVLTLILGSMCLERYNPSPSTALTRTMCRSDTYDTLWFGNRSDNGVAFLDLGATSVLELVTIVVFTIEYALRVWTADFLSPLKYAGWMGRLRWMISFYSLVDLVSIVPFYMDTFVWRNSEVSAVSFVRMFRFVRMMRTYRGTTNRSLENRFDSAWNMIDDVIQAQLGVLMTTGFVGVTVWMAVSSLYYLAERGNTAMIYCASCENDTIDPTQTCRLDEWGSVVDCDVCVGCYHLYESIPMASYYALLNLFGEFPLIDSHSTAGKVVATLTTVVAVAVFALPVGIIGNGIRDAIVGQRRTAAPPVLDESGVTLGFRAMDTTWRSRLYNLLHAQTAHGAWALDAFINILIVATSLSFMLDTVAGLPPIAHVFFDSFELISVTIFTVEYVMRVYSAKEDPKYSGPAGRFRYMATFLAVVDMLSFLPYWLEAIWSGGHVISSTSSTGSDIVKALRLLRILRFERYTHAFLVFDDAVTINKDILTVTALTAILLWVFFAVCLYWSERDSLDAEIAANYNTIPNSMWMTLLNLSGESPLSQYSVWGKVFTATLGLVATGVFGIPIGVLGAGFEEIVARENQDDTRELEAASAETSRSNVALGSTVERKVFAFVQGVGSRWAVRFELSVYALIVLSVAVGAWQTVAGQEQSFQEIEYFAVFVFTIEYLLRLVGAGANPEFTVVGGSSILCRLRFVVSFYSVIDLLAIIPFYVTVALPNSIVNDYDEYLRMLRILRLIKLDKYVPSISLIDDVIRLKFATLRVSFYASVTLWILFAAALFLTEHGDDENAIDPVPLYGCDEECTMSYRFRNYFDSLLYTGVHLTGDYPIVTYSLAGRMVNFFMVIAAVGIVSIPSAVIASGFVDIVRHKNRLRRSSPDAFTGDDWYEVRYSQLEGTEPPASPFGPKVDTWQSAVNEFLNGKETDNGRRDYSTVAYAARVSIFALILANVMAVLLESIPIVDRYVGNQRGNFFDQFELFSVMIFATEYLLRLFCAPKNREALFSTFTYATTFFGIVDFLSTAPWFLEQILIASGNLDAGGENARIFRIFRIFRILQLEDFIVAFSKLDNVFRASKDVLKATGLMAIIVWVTCGALFFIFEENNPNWRSCDASIPLHSNETDAPGCYDFSSTASCNQFYPGMCAQKAFVNMPDSLYYTAVFLGGEWGVVDFTWPGRCVCLFLCVIGIGLYSIPVGTLFDSFGNVLGLGGDEDEGTGETEPLIPPTEQPNREEN